MMISSTRTVTKIMVDKAYIDGSAYFTVDQGGESVDPRALGEVGDDKIVKRHGKGQEKAGEDPGQDIRKHYLKKRVYRGRPQIHGCLIDAFIGLL